MKKNNKNNNFIPPPAPPDSSVPSLPEPPVPVKIYPNSDTCKAQILSDNQNKSGIYMWKNLTNEKCYIGSAVNLSKILSCYYSTAYMENELNRGHSHIYCALLKNGYSNFSLTILEYCESEQCLEREDYYLYCLPHEYNILQKAGSSLGHNHSDEKKKNKSLIL